MKSVRPYLIAIVVLAIAAIVSTLAWPAAAGDPAPSPAPAARPQIVAPSAQLLPNTQYPFELKNFPAELQGKSVLVAHPRAGVSMFPVSWGTKSQVLFSAPSGPYDISLYYPDTSGAVAEVEVSVIVGGPSANPTPGPGPDGKPGPKAQPAVQRIPAGSLYTIGFLPDLSAQTPVQASVQLDPTLRNLLDSRGDHFLWVDPASAGTALAPWVESAKRLGMPVVLIAADGDAAGAYHEAMSLAGATPADVVALVKKWQAPAGN